MSFMLLIRIFINKIVDIELVAIYKLLIINLHIDKLNVKKSLLEAFI